MRCGINYNRVCSRAGNGERCCVAGMPGKSHRAIGHVQLALRPAKKRKRFSLQNVVVKKLSFFLSSVKKAVRGHRRALFVDGAADPALSGSVRRAGKVKSVVRVR